MVSFLDSKQTFGVEKGDSIVQCTSVLKHTIGTGKVHAVSCLEDVVKVLQNIRKTRCLKFTHSFPVIGHIVFDLTFTFYIKRLFGINAGICVK